MDNRKKHTILLVEDNDIAAKSLQKWLEGENYQVIRVDDGTEATQSVKLYQLDVLLVDLNLPGFKALEFVEYIVNNFSHMAIVLMTNPAHVEKAVECIRLGAFDYILKPFPPEKLSGLLKRIITLKTLQAAHQHLQEQMESTDVYLRREERLMNLGKYASMLAVDLSQFLQRPEFHNLIESSPNTELIMVYKRWIKLLNRLSNVTKYMEDERQDISLNEVVNNGLILARRQSSVTEAHIDIRLKEPLPYIEGRFWSLVHILANLIYNAVKAIKNDQKIHIVTQLDREQETVYVEITDHGVGIEADDMEFVFEPFFCGWENCTGAGLGLTISKAIVESLKGKLSITSTAGQGSCVRLDFPVYSDEQFKGSLSDIYEYSIQNEPNVERQERHGRERD
jgi:signal transduction histidine kinase